MTLRRGFLVVSLSLLLVAAATAAPAPDVKTDPHESLETLITEGIRLVEAKEYVKLIEFLVSPEELAKMKVKKETIEDIAKEFGGKKADVLLKVLKQIKTQKPTLSGEGTKATYKLKEIDGAGPEISFKRIEKQWYLDGR